MKAEDASRSLEAATLPSPGTGAIIRVAAIQRIDLTDNRIRLTIDRNVFADWLAGAPASTAAIKPNLHIIDLPLSIR